MAAALDVPTLRTHLATTSPGAHVVDVRTPVEYESAHIPGSVNVPLAEVQRHRARIAAEVAGTGRRLVVVCQTGERAERARATLEEAGLPDTAVLSGGVDAWAVEAPVAQGRRRWAMERQVRLVAGSLVLASVLVGIWWPPAVALAGFIGAGLTFAALTNTCAMAKLLSQLPYNRAEAGRDIDTALALLRRA